MRSVMMISSAFVLLGILITTDAIQESLSGLNKPTLTMDGPGFVSSNFISDSSLNIRDPAIEGTVDNMQDDSWNVQPGFTFNVIHDSFPPFHDYYHHLDDLKYDGIQSSVALDDSSSNGMSGSAHIAGLQQESTAVSGLTEGNFMEREQKMDEPETLLNMNVNSVPLEDSSSNGISRNIGGLQQDSAVVSGLTEGNFMDREPKLIEPETLINMVVNSGTLEKSSSNDIRKNIGKLQQDSAVDSALNNQGLDNLAVKDLQNDLGSEDLGLENNVFLDDISDIKTKMHGQNVLDEKINSNVDRSEMVTDEHIIDHLDNTHTDIDKHPISVVFIEPPLVPSLTEGNFMEHESKMNGPETLNMDVNSDKSELSETLLNIDVNSIPLEDSSSNDINRNVVGLQQDSAVGSSLNNQGLDNLALGGLQNAIGLKDLGLEKDAIEDDLIDQSPKMHDQLVTDEMNANFDKPPITNKLDPSNDADTSKSKQFDLGNSQSTRLNNAGTVIEVNDAWGFLFQNTFSGPLAHKYSSISQITSNYSQGGQNKASPPDTYTNVTPDRNEQQMAKNIGTPVMLDKGVAEANNRGVLIVFNNPKHFTFQNTFTGTANSETQV